MKNKPKYIFKEEVEGDLSTHPVYQVLEGVNVL